MGLFSVAKLFGVTLRESADDGSDFTNPDADYRRVFLGEDGALHAKDSAGTVTTLGGATDHGALTGLTDDDHTQYLKETDVAAKGDIYAASANDTVGVLSAGTNGHVLTLDSAQSLGVKWAAASVADGFPGLLTSTKGSPDTPDDDFTGTSKDAKWTATDGSASTIALLGGTGSIWQVGLIDSWVHFLIGTASGDSVEWRQDYTLPDGACIIAPIFIGPDNAGSGGGIANNEWDVGIGINSDDTGPFLGSAATTFAVEVDAQASVTGRVLSFDGTTVLGQTNDNAMFPRALFVRIDRVGLVYHGFWAPMTMGYPAWEYLGSKTLGGAATNVWLFAQAGATSAFRINAGVPWFRQGTALAIKPW